MQRMQLILAAVRPHLMPIQRMLLLVIKGVLSYSGLFWTLYPLGLLLMCPHCSRVRAATSSYSGRTIETILAATMLGIRRRRLFATICIQVNLSNTSVEDNMQNLLSCILS